MRKLLLGFVTSLFLVTGLSAQQTTPLYRFSCSAATWPACGLNLVPENIYHRKTFLPTGGPQGQSATKFEHLQADHQMQYYFGWGTIPNLAAVPQGAARYFRLRIYFEPGTNFAGNQGPWSAKFFIVADGQNVGTNRIVGHIGVGGVNDTDIYLGGSRNIDGGIYAIPAPRFLEGQWYNVEYRFQSSSSSGVANGSIAMRVDGGPWLSSGQFVFTTEGWNTFALGRISQTTLAAPLGHFNYIIANDWEWDDEPDPNWHQGSTTPPPPQPACSDGVDNDGDGLIDASDPGCSGTTDTDEFNTTPPPPAVEVCGDNIDNDGDGLVDEGCAQTVPAPAVNTVTPNNGPIEGGTQVVITGRDFVSGAGHVYFGGVEASVQALVGSTELRVTAPPHAAGSVSIVVRNPDGQEGLLSNAFTYNAPVPVDPCIVDPLRVTSVTWPDDDTARTRVIFDIGTKRLQRFMFQWPNRLEVTDTRNCTIVVSR